SFFSLDSLLFAEMPPKHNGGQPADPHNGTQSREREKDILVEIDTVTKFDEFKKNYEPEFLGVLKKEIENNPELKPIVTKIEKQWGNFLGSLNFDRKKDRILVQKMVETLKQIRASGNP